MKIAEASARYKIGDGVKLSPLEPIRAKWHPTKQTFTVKTEDKVQLLSEVVQSYESARSLQGKRFNDELQRRKGVQVHRRAPD